MIAKSRSPDSVAMHCLEKRKNLKERKKETRNRYIKIIVFMMKISFRFSEFCLLNKKMVFGFFWFLGFIYGNTWKKTDTNGH